MSTDCFQKAPNSQALALAPTATARLDGHLAGWNWTQLLMLTLAFWAALLYSGMGSAMGLLPDAAANRIEARVLTQWRQGGTSQASRWARAEPGIEVSTWAVVSSPPVLLHTPIGAVLPLPGFWFEPAERQTEPQELTGLPARAAPRWQTPLTRAPPSKVFQA